MEFFQTYKRIIAWLVIIIFIFGGGYGIFMKLGSISTRPISYVPDVNYNKSFPIAVEDYYKVYEEGENYKLYVKYIFVKSADRNIYLRKFELLDNSKNVVYEEEMIPLPIHIVIHDNGLIEVIQFYTEEDTRFSIFYNPNSGEFSNMQYIDTIDEGRSSYFLNFKDDTLVIIPYGYNYAVIDIFNKEKYFRIFDLSAINNNESEYLESIILTKEDELELRFYSNIGPHYKTVKLNSQNDDSSGLDEYNYRIITPEPLINQTFYDDISDYYTYDEVEKLMNQVGKKVFVTKYNSQIIGYLGENYEIYLKFDPNGNICGKQRNLR